MSTTWYITKEYLKRLEITFEEKGRKTFNLMPYGPPKTEEIEVFPGTNWITLTTRLFVMQKNDQPYPLISDAGSSYLVSN